MENVVKNFNLIKQEITDKKKVKLVAVTKTFSISHILPVINEGHTDFGENKVQEAMEKWTSIKQDFPKINLHLIGKLQTNKVKFVLPLFDYIHSLDNLKLANKLAEEQNKKNFKPKIFITGGLSSIFRDKILFRPIYKENLTLEGIREIGKKYL